jgi:hypothetical protein
VIGTFWRRSLAFAIVIMLSLGWEGITTQRLSFLDLRVVARMWFDVPRWAREHLPTNAMIFSQDLSGSLYYYTDLAIVRFDAIREDKLKSFFEAAEIRGGQFTLLAGRTKWMRLSVKREETGPS